MPFPNFHKNPSIPFDRQTNQSRHNSYLFKLQWKSIRNFWIILLTNQSAEAQTEPPWGMYSIFWIILLTDKPINRGTILVPYHTLFKLQWKSIRNFWIILLTNQSAEAQTEPLWRMYSIFQWWFNNKLRHQQVTVIKKYIEKLHTVYLKLYKPKF